MFELLKYLTEKL